VKIDISLYITDDQLFQTLNMIMQYSNIISNNNVDIKLGVQDTFLELSSLGTYKTERFELQIILKFWEQ
jgi:hypothetical protein